MVIVIVIVIERFTLRTKLILLLAEILGTTISTRSWYYHYRFTSISTGICIGIRTSHGTMIIVYVYQHSYLYWY